MTHSEHLRLQCLQLASQQNYGVSLGYILETAAAMYRYVMEGTIPETLPMVLPREDYSLSAQDQTDNQDPVTAQSDIPIETRIDEDRSYAPAS